MAKGAEGVFNWGAHAPNAANAPNGVPSASFSIKHFGIFFLDFGIMCFDFFYIYIYVCMCVIYIYALT